MTSFHIPLRDTLKRPAAFLVGLTLCASAHAGLVFFDSFEMKEGLDAVGTVPEVGWTAYARLGAAALPVSTRQGERVADVGSVDPSRGLIIFGPWMPSERWLRLDFPGEGQAVVVVVPHLRETGAGGGAGQPAIWPEGPGTGWGKARAGFLGETGGTAVPESIDLAALYPACDRSRPFHLEAHWKATSPSTAILETRVWNDDAPPPFASGSAVTFTLAAGAWEPSARAGLAGSGVPATGMVSSLAAFNTAPQWPNIISATGDAIAWSGQWATSGVEVQSCIAGGRLQALETGDFCRLRLRSTGNAYATPPFSFRVDGGVWQRVWPAQGATTDVALYENLAWGTHSVEVCVSDIYGGQAWSQMDARFRVSGLVVPPGGSAEPLPFPERRILFVGDSLMNGFWVSENPLPGSEATKLTEARLSAPYLVGQWLGMEAVNLSVTGLGFSKPGDATGQPAITHLQFALPGVPWQPSREPEAVVVALGTNDRDVAKYPDAMLETAAREYYVALRSRSPSARIFALSPWSGHRVTVLRRAFESPPIPNSQWVDVTGWLDLQPFHDANRRWHQGTAGHVKLAKRLAELLRGHLSYSGASPTALISSPGRGDGVFGNTAITGSALGNGFAGFRVEAASDAAPDVWWQLAESRRPVAGATLAHWDTPEFSEGSWTLRLTVEANDKTAAAQAKVRLIRLGDVDGDGDVTGWDAALALRIASGLQVAPKERFGATDVAPADGPSPGDGKVSLADAISIARHAANPALPWR